jgi:hypothetical protein
MKGGKEMGEEKQSLSECIRDALERMNPGQSIENNFKAGFLAGWLRAAMTFGTVDICKGERHD